MGAPDFFIDLRGGGARPKKFENHCIRASLHSGSGRSDKNQCRGAKSGRC